MRLLTIAYYQKIMYLCISVQKAARNYNYKNMYQGKKIVQPPYLKPGDKVAFISPAYWVPQEAIQLAAETIKGWGLQPVIGPHTNNLNVNAYAGTADERAADLQWAFEDSSIKAIICSRGGYGSLQTYLVDNEGNIEFPVIGKIHVQGLTKNQCQDLIKSKIQPYLAETENPIVTVRMSSYRVTITGAVSRPTVVPVTTEKMSIIEAITSAGDLSIYGKRENIILIREKETGEKEYHRLNLNDANIINSPYYYLQQNDIIYVEPNKVLAKNSSIGSSTTIWFSFIGIVTSVASLLVNILRN